MTTHPPAPRTATAEPRAGVEPLRPPEPPAPESLLDRADLAALRAGAGRLSGPFATVAACLVAGGALEHDPDEPGWPDRDRLVAGDRAAAEGVTAALQHAGHPPAAAPGGSASGAGVVLVPAWEALPYAAGLAAASRLDGGVFRTWCLLGPGTVDHGATWEAARTAVAAKLDTLVAVLVAAAAPCGEAQRVLGAAGWATFTVGSDAPAELLSALDHALAAGTPALVTAVIP